VIVAKTSNARSLCHGEAGVSGYSLLLLPSPPALSRIVDHKTARTHARARRAGDGSLECPLIIVCNAILSTVDPVCIDARISADTTVADTIRYFDTIHPVSVPIRYRSDNRPFSTHFTIRRDH